MGTLRETDLASERCREYPPGTPPLSEDEATELHPCVARWTREDTHPLHREFSFEDFSGAFGLVVGSHWWRVRLPARVALIAVSEGHHPDIELGWGRAAFQLTTHAASDVTRNDFVLAAKIDQLD